MALTQVQTTGIADDAVTLAKQAAGTDGQIITYDASGNPTAVGPGTDGQVLTSTGAGSPPAFETLPTSGAALTGSTNNTVVTVTGANAMQGEAALTFDGTVLTTSTDVSITGASGNTRLNFNRTDAAGSNGNQFGLLKFQDNNDNQVAGIEAVRASAVDDADIVFKTRPTGGSVTERVRVDSSGKLLLNTTDVPSQGADTFTVKAADGGNAGITIRTGTGNTGNIFFSDGTSGTGEYAGYMYYAHGTDKLHFGMDAADRLVIGSGGDIEVSTGDIVLKTAGKGICLGVTSNTDGNTLDDYEEGTWTPTDQSGQGLSFTNNNTANYTKIGRLVTAHFDITYPTTSASDVCQVSIPFNNATSWGGGVVNWNDFGKPGFIHISGNKAYINDNNNSVGNSSAHILNSEASGKRFMCNFWYYSAT